MMLKLYHNSVVRGMMNINLMKYGTIPIVFSEKDAYYPSLLQLHRSSTGYSGVMLEKKCYLM